MVLAHSLEKSTSIFYTQNLHFLWKFNFTTTHIAASSELTGKTEISGPSDKEKDWIPQENKNWMILLGITAT